MSDVILKSKVKVIDNSAISVICNYLTDILKSRNIY